ncbi:MAG: TetR/AcrR family transcriptional regulator [Termitinemataceae bacterium]
MQEQEYHKGMLENSDTRSKILDAAEQIAREQGISALSMRGIAERIGLSAPAAYRHFASKSEIVEAMIERGYRKFMEGLAVARKDVSGSLHILKVTLEYYLRFWMQDRAGFRIVAEWSKEESFLSEAAIFAGSFGDLPDLVEDIMGSSRDHQQVAIFSRCIAAALYGITLSVVQDTGIPREQEEELAAAAAEFLIQRLIEYTNHT